MPSQPLKTLLVGPQLRALGRRPWERPWDVTP